MNRIDRNVAERQVLIEILVGAHVPATGLQPHFDAKLAAFADSRDVQVAIEDFDVLIALNLGGEDFTGLIGDEPNGFDALAHDLERDLLQVEDDVGSVFNDAGDGAELVFRALDFDGRNGRAFDGAEQNAAQAVADGGAESALERLRRELTETVGQGVRIGHQAFWFLEAFKHSFFLECCHLPGRTPAGYFGYKSTNKCLFNAKFTHSFRPGGAAIL